MSLPAVPPSLRLLLGVLVLVAMLAEGVGTARSGEHGRALTLWTTEVEPDRQATIRFLLSAFEALGGGVPARLEAIEENRLLARMAEARRAGELPDLVHADTTLLAALGEAGMLDLDAAGKLIERIGRARFAPAALASTATGRDDIHFAVPYSAWIQAIWYRSDWFAEAGLPPPDSWANLIAAARRFDDPANGRHSLVMGTRGDLYAAQSFLMLAAANEATGMAGDGTPAFDTPQMIEALETYRLLSAFVPSGKGNVAGRTEFLQGRAAMLIYSSFLARSLVNEATPDLLRNVGMAVGVENRRRAAFGTVVSIGFGAGRNAGGDEVGRLAEFLYRPDAYVAGLHMAPGGMLPVLNDVVEDAAFYRDAEDVYRRLGQSRVRRLVAGIRAFDHPADPGHAARATARRVAIVPEMLARALSGSPRAAAAWAQAQALELDRSTFDNGARP